MSEQTALTPEAMSVYRATARRRHEKEQQERARREEQAWALARKAAALLREQYGATRVVVFGSLTHAGMFTLWSDVDIAAWGIEPEDTLRALGAVLYLDAGIQVNLVDVNTAPVELIIAIDHEGIECD